MATATPASKVSDKKVVTPGNDNAEPILEPHDNDVLCGRGGSINSHPGNERFRQLVEKRKRVYLTARFKREKRLIASSIVTEIRELDPPGRFLTKPTKGGPWVDIGDEKARDKTSQALRENAPTIRAEIETEINQQRAEMKRAEDEEASSLAPTSAVPPAPYYHPWGGGHYGPIYGYGHPPPDVPPPNYPPPGPYQPWEGHYAYHPHPPPPPPVAQEQSPSPVTQPAPPSASHPAPMDTTSAPMDTITASAPAPAAQAPTPPPAPPTHQEQHPATRTQQQQQEEIPKSTFDGLPSFVSSVSSMAAWTRNSFSFGAHSNGSEDHHDEAPEESKPLPYVHRAEGRPKVTFRDDYHRATEHGRAHHRHRHSANHPYRHGYSSLRTRGPRQSKSLGHHPRPPPKRAAAAATAAAAPSYEDDDQNNSLLSQVASHIMGSWETPIPCAHGSSDDLAIQGAPRGTEEGQEVELVEMMSFEDPIIEEDDDIREDESCNMPPPQDRRVEIDWPSRVGSCHTWLPEAPSFFSVQDNPLSPTASMDMDHSAAGAFSCGGSIGGASLCQVFAQDQISDKASGTPQIDHKVLNQIPSWERSFHSNAPSLGSNMSADSDIMSKTSDKLGSSTGGNSGHTSPVPLILSASPRNSIAQMDYAFEQGRMRE